MKAVVVYKENSEHARPVIEFLRDFEHQTGKELEQIDPESREGADFCRTYDIVEYPTIIALDDEGKLLQMWPGLPLPRIMEVSYYSPR
jgi:hypothetical protein